MPVNAPQRVALIRLGALGDVVLAGSLVRALAEAGCEVTLVTDSRYAALAAAMPDLHRCAQFDRARHTGLSGLRAVARQIGAVDVIVDLQRKPRTAILSRLTSAGERRALVLRPAWRGLLALVGRDPVLVQRHQTELALDVVRDLVSVQLPRPPRLRVEVPRSAGQVALAPGAAHGAKCWPAERYGELTAALIAEGRQVAVVAGPGEQALVHTISAGAGRDLPSTLGQGVEAVLQMCAASALVVAGDTGPAHLAAAVGTPVLSIFGPTSPRRWRPLGSGEVIATALDCQPCSNHSVERCPLGHHRCMTDLGVEQVLGAAHRLLEVAP